MRINESHLQLVKKNLEKFIGSSAFTDVTFELDDGKMKSHRAMLISRCDMMRAMLNGDFREAHAHTVCRCFTEKCCLAFT